MKQPFSKPSLSALRPGLRVSVRHRVLDGTVHDSGTAASLTDTVGEIVAISDSDLVVRTRAGQVRIPSAAVTAAREIPPRAARPGPRHRVIASADLQRLGLDGLPPLHRKQVGDWVLRASEGVTYRGNSALALDDGAPDLDVAITAVETFYAEQGTVPLIQLADGVPGMDAVRERLARRGWREFQETVVMTAPSLEVAGPRTLPDGLVFTDSADAVWFGGAAEREREQSAVAARMLAGVRDGRYARLVSPEGETVAVGRTCASPRWAGVFSVHVRPAHRGQGLGRSIMQALAVDAAARGAESLFLQVTTGNATAIGLYRQLGFEVHHTYRYASPGGVHLG